MENFRIIKTVENGVETATVVYDDEAPQTLVEQIEGDLTLEETPTKKKKQ